ncbi:MAG TPA: MmcQ/YjbR family DNA-binding protein [Streptosporangiaceae bacterium]|jgi:hypothetical protein
MITVDQVRDRAMALPGVSEEPHFDMTSFRVLGRIFATVAADEARLHVFMDEDEARACAAEDPVAFEPLRWGRRIRGVRVLLTTAPPDRVLELIEESWRRKAPRRLVAGLDSGPERPAGG